MVYIVKPGIRLIKTNENVWVSFEGRVDTLSQVGSVILLLSDGTNTPEEVAEKVSILYDEKYEAVLNDVLSFYKTQSKYFIKLNKKLNKPLYIVRDPNEFKFFPKKQKVKEFYGIWSIGIILSEKCPMRCKYCYAFKDNYDTGLEFVEFDLLKKFISEATELGALNLLIGGGDPLRYERLPEVIEFAIQNGIKKIDISTKPSKIYSIEYFNNLFRAGLREIQFSIDAVTPAVLNKIVGHPKYYDYLIPSLYNAAHVGLQIVVKTVLIKDNLNEVLPLVDFLYNFGIKKLNINTASPLGMATFDMIPSKEEEKELKNAINKYRKSHPDIIINFSGSIFNENNPDIVRCSAFKTSCFLYPDGSIEGCDFIGAYRKEFNLSLGNLKEKTLKEIWANSEKSYIFRSTPDDPICASCQLKDVCLGGCKAFSLEIFGSINRSFNYCVPVLNAIKGRKE